MLLVQAGVDLRVRAMKGTQLFPKIQHYWNLIIRLFCVISRTFVGRVLPLFRDAVGVFYSPSWLDWDCLVSYTGHSLRECYLSAKVLSVYSESPADWATEHSLGERYPSAEIQSVYSTAPVDWATRHSLGECYPSADMQSVYYAAPADWATRHD